MNSSESSSIDELNKELELQYSPTRWSKRFSSAEKLVENHVKISKTRTNIVREQIPCRVDIQYGNKKKSKLDVYGEDLPSESPIVVYVHGGYWQELEKDLSLHPVEPLYKNNIMTIVMGYTLAPESSVAEIVEEIRKGIRWVCDYAKKRGSDGVFLMGWSAGAQLIIQAMVRSNVEEQECFKIIFGLVTFSGIFDLRPLVTIYVNDALHLNDNEAYENSPLKYDNIVLLKKKFPHMSALITFGENDSDEFKKQSIQYSQELVSVGIQASCKEYSVDHFDIVENLCYDDYQLTKDILSVVNAHSIRNRD